MAAMDSRWQLPSQGGAGSETKNEPLEEPLATKEGKPDVTPRKEVQKDRGWRVNGSGQTGEKAVRGKAGGSVTASIGSRWSVRQQRDPERQASELDRRVWSTGRVTEDYLVPNIGLIDSKGREGIARE